MGISLSCNVSGNSVKKNDPEFKVENSDRGFLKF